MSNLLYKSIILSILLYGSESWKMTNKICQMLETFQNQCLRRILRIYWLNKISNIELKTTTCTRSVETEVRYWRCTGRVCRMDKAAIPKVAMCWTADGKRKRGRPKETWWCTVEKELKDHHLTWDTVTTRAQDRGKWREFLDALCTLGCSQGESEWQFLNLGIKEWLKLKSPKYMSHCCNILHRFVALNSSNN